MDRFYFFVSIGLRGAAILLFLGFWQMQRLEWKEGVIAEINSRMVAEPVTLPQSPDSRRDAYLPVRVTGQFVGKDDLRVLVSQKGSGAAYRVISAFDTATDRIMVDRGIMPIDQQNTTAPDGEVTIIGNLQWPDETDNFTPAPEVDTNIWFAREVDPMAAVLKTAPVLLVAREVIPPSATMKPLPVDTSRIPNNHLQYAITWFSLAVVWLAMTLFFVFRSRRAPLEG